MKRNSIARLCCVLLLVAVLATLPVTAFAQGTVLTTVVPTHHTLQVEITGRGSVSVNGTTYTKDAQIAVERQSVPAISVQAAAGYAAKSVFFKGNNVTGELVNGGWIMPRVVTDATLSVTFVDRADYKMGVTRLAGSNRFDTAFKSADALKEVMGVDKFPAAIVTSGMNFADALAGSYLAAEMDAPILLTDNDNMADVIAYIRENVEVGGVVYALGGSSIVSDSLRAVTSSGYTFKRLAGASRFETNLLILEEAGIDSGDPVLVCTAYNFADSLSASALGLPILLVDDTVSAAQMAFLEENADGEFILVGGTGAVKPAVEEQLREKWDVVRLAGASRFDTSVLTAIESFGYSVDYAVLAYGYNFPDGLCAGPLAYALGAPLILTANGDEGAAVEYATAAGITDGFVLGGPSLINDGVVYRIFSMGAGEDIQ